MPTTEAEAAEFAANVADPTRHLRKASSVEDVAERVPSGSASGLPSESDGKVDSEAAPKDGAGADSAPTYVADTSSCMFHPDLGYVGAGMPTTEAEAAEFAANVADPTRHLRKASSVEDVAERVPSGSASGLPSESDGKVDSEAAPKDGAGADSAPTYVADTSSCMFHPDLGFVGGGPPTNEAEASEFALNAMDPTRHLRSSSSGSGEAERSPLSSPFRSIQSNAQTDHGGRAPSDNSAHSDSHNSAVEPPGAGVSDSRPPAGIFARQDNNSDKCTASKSGDELNGDSQGDMSPTRRPSEFAKLARRSSSFGGRNSINGVARLNRADSRVRRSFMAVLEPERIMCRDLRTSGFRCPAFVDEKLKAARQHMLLSRGFTNYSSSTLRPVSRDLLGVSRPRFFRPDIDMELATFAVRTATTTADEDLILFLEGFGMSSRILGEDVRSGAVGKSKVDGATGMRMAHRVSDDLHDLQDQEFDDDMEFLFGDGSFWLDEELDGKVDRSVESLLCRDIRASGFMSPAFCSSELRDSRLKMLMGRNSRSCGTRLLIPSAREMMSSCCPMYIRSLLAETVEEVIDFEISEERRQAQFEGLGMSNSRSTVLGVGVHAGSVDDKRRIDGVTGLVIDKLISDEVNDSEDGDDDGEADDADALVL